MLWETGACPGGSPSSSGSGAFEGCSVCPASLPSDESDDDDAVRSKSPSGTEPSAPSVVTAGTSALESRTVMSVSIVYTLTPP